MIDYSKLLGFGDRTSVERVDFRSDGLAPRVGAKVGSSSEPAVVCLLRGTLVRTPDGECPVEDLAIGDGVVTAIGEAKRVRWIGRQRFRRAEGRAWVGRVLPVRIARGALGGDAPTRDLYLSQAHAVAVGGSLVPAGKLLNGRTITIDRATDLVTLDYFNIELDAHGVVLAEGAPVETFLSRNGNREAFDNFVEYERLYGGEAYTPAASAPGVSAEGRLERIRSRLRNAIETVTPRSQGSFTRTTVTSRPSRGMK